MIVLGIHDGHNASAALVRDGEIVAAVQEERLSRVKNQSGLPRRAIDEVLELAKVRPDEVDAYAVADQYRAQEWGTESMLRDLAAAERRRPAREWLSTRPSLRKLRDRQLGLIRTRRLAALGLPRNRTHILEHHHCHAAASYYSQGVLDEDVLVLTADASGDHLSATVNIGRKGRLERTAEVPDTSSLGILYSYVTYLMGMLPMEHEYKVMGLAPYGEKSREQARQVHEKFRSLFLFQDDGVTWSLAPGVPSMPRSLSALRDLIFRERFDWLAAGLQSFLEDMLVEWVESCVRQTGLRKVALGGGLFMNVKANERILASPEVERLFVMPSSGDETNSIGAAYSVASSVEGSNPPSGNPSGQGVRPHIVPLRSLYLGSTIDDHGAEAALLRAGSDRLSWRRSDSPEKEVASLIAAGRIVARATGPMEFGARALGNRSILADPSRIELVSVINDMIKIRDFWMPFAPSVLAERSDEYLAKPKPICAPHMTVAFASKPEKRHALRAASHPADHTVRVQEVTEEGNLQYYRLIQEVAALTGEGAVLNTSFNLHGYPIVRTADDALDVFLRSGLEHMQLARFVVGKRR